MLNMKRYALVILTLLYTSCSLIDDDLSVCGVDCYVTYDMRMQVNIEAVIEAELASVDDAPIAVALGKWLEPVFSGFAHDLNMLFYDQDKDHLQHAMQKIVDSKSASYTVYVPRGNYFHVAMVNSADNVNVSVEDTAYVSYVSLIQHAQDTLPSYNTTIYTGRTPILLTDSSTQSHHVNLYMTTCAVALIVEPDEQVQDMQVLVSGSASGFRIQDSVYTYTRAALIRMDKVSEQCYAAVTLPSRDAPSGSTPARRQAQDAAKLWQLRAYSTLSDGSVTETLIDMHSPLEAGTLQLIRVRQAEDGSLQPMQNIDASVNVTLDWNDGGSHDIDL